MLANFSEDASLIKRFSIREGMSLQFRFEMLNLFNRHYFAGPGMTMSDTATFGNITRTGGGSNRTGQFGLRLDW
jgi:hypothetical protein